MLYEVMDPIYQRINGACGYNVSVHPLGDMLGHARIAGGYDGHATRQRFGGSIPEAILIAWMHKHIGLLQDRQRIAGGNGDARVASTGALHIATHSGGGPSAYQSQTKRDIRQTSKGVNKQRNPFGGIKTPNIYDVERALV